MYVLPYRSSEPVAHTSWLQADEFRPERMLDEKFEAMPVRSLVKDLPMHLTFPVRTMPGNRSAMACVAA